MEYSNPSINSNRHPIGQAGQDSRPYDGLEAVPPGLEPSRPQDGLMVSQDDAKEWASNPTQEAGQPQGIQHSRVGSRWIIVIALLLSIVAIGVGVGVGITRKSKSTPTVTTTHTATVTSSSVAPTATDGGCVNGTIYNSTNGTPFTEFCDVDFRVSETYGTYAADWGFTNVSTFAACMEACAYDRSQNVQQQGIAGTCLSVTWESAPGGGFGNCFLKNNTANGWNKTAPLTYAVPVAEPGLQSANILTVP
jgi:hypothetical protein